MSSSEYLYKYDSYSCSIFDELLWLILISSINSDNFSFVLFFSFAFSKISCWDNTFPFECKKGLILISDFFSGFFWLKYLDEVDTEAKKGKIYFFDSIFVLIIK